ncbi:hypothetical protein QTG54_004267 [Skeletonema marinoi]|uniref:Uncharacterized protein n=1 Tax=Skeletonema marinoi TaxID=267567 RepID=A0AAD8YGY4_9STRA|nr:hypothetical protein QTG54_004267 [Skeletonema marinoi]
MSTSSSSGWHRSSVQATLELLTALMEYPDNNAIFTNVPNTVVRVMALKFMRYDATIDTDVRDRACEVLASLTELSDHSKVALGMSHYKCHMKMNKRGHQ